MSVAPFASPTQQLPPLGFWGDPGGIPSTYVDFPQIFLWYHCLQFVKYFLFVPISFCTAQTLGLQGGTEQRSESLENPTMGVRGRELEELTFQVLKWRKVVKESSLPHSTLQGCIFLHWMQGLASLHATPLPKYKGIELKITSVQLWFLWWTPTSNLET